MTTLEKTDDRHKSLSDLLEATAYRIWLMQMGLHETYNIIITGSDYIYE